METLRRKAIGPVKWQPVAIIIKRYDFIIVFLYNNCIFSIQGINKIRDILGGIDMKKLLLLAGILAASGVIFAADKALNEDQAEVKVTATVVASLIIKDVKNVDFGYLAAGTEKEYSSEGGFTIVGGSKCKVILEAKDGNSSDDFKAVTGTPIQVVMTNPNGVGNNAKMTSNLTLTLKNAPINNGSIKLGYASYDKETGKKAGEKIYL